MGAKRPEPLVVNIINNFNFEFHQNVMASWVKIQYKFFKENFLTPRQAKYYINYLLFY